MKRIRAYQGWIFMGLLMMVGFVNPGCTSSHSVLVLAESHGDSQRRVNANTAAEIAADKGTDTSLRAHAWKVVGRLRAYSPRVQSAFEAVVPKSGEDENLRRMAIWALGEVGRETTWERGGRALHGVALKALSGPLTRESALQLVEAIAKIYPQHEHTGAEDRQTFMALNALQSKYKKELPGLYYTVLKLVSDLGSLSEALDDTLKKAKGGAGDQDKARVYGAALALLRVIEENHDPILASFEVRRARIAYAFETLTRTLKEDDKRVVLMVAWSLGRLASDPRLARLVAQSLSELLPSQDPAVAFVVAWSLIQMDEVTAGREGLREKVLKASSDPQLLKMIAIREGRERVDLIQSLHGMSPEDSR